MKPAFIESSIGLDRIATWNEILSAMSVSPKDDLKFAGAWGDIREMEADFSGSACNLPEDDMWLMLISETPDTAIN